MAKLKEKLKAQQLRKSGESIKIIADKLKVSKSTVSVWCRDIALSKENIKKIAATGNQRATIGLLKYSEAKRRERQKQEIVDRDKGATKLGTLSDRDIYCLGLGLYWGEGYKRGSQEFGFTNSDPQMITFYLLWLKQVFHVGKSNLVFRISINEQHKDRLNDVLEYWSNLLSVPTSQFTKTSLIKTSVRKKYPNHEEHMGTLRVKVRNGTRLRRQVLGAIESIR